MAAALAEFDLHEVHVGAPAGDGGGGGRRRRRRRRAEQRPQEAARRIRPRNGDGRRAERRHRQRLLAPRLVLGGAAKTRRRHGSNSLHCCLSIPAVIIAKLIQKRLGKTVSLRLIAYAFPNCGLDQNLELGSFLAKLLPNNSKNKQEKIMIKRSNRWYRRGGIDRGG